MQKKIGGSFQSPPAVVIEVRLFSQSEIQCCRPYSTSQNIRVSPKGLGMGELFVHTSDGFSPEISDSGFSRQPFSLLPSGLEPNRFGGGPVERPSYPKQEPRVQIQNQIQNDQGGSKPQGVGMCVGGQSALLSAGFHQAVKHSYCGHVKIVDLQTKAVGLPSNRPL